LGTERDGGGIQVYVTRLSLKSEKQPEVFRLSCGQWGYPPQLEHVTIGEMRKALGEILTLTLAAKK